MTSLLDNPPTTTPSRQNNTTQNPSRRLRSTMAAVRLAFTWFGVRKSLNPEQKSRAAETFGAEGEYLSAGKKLLDTSHSAFRGVTAVRTRIQTYWRDMSLPFTDPGIRLIRQDEIGHFTVQMTTLRAELQEAVAELASHYGELRQAARERLGSLFNAGDYPPMLDGLFGVTWDFPNIEPPEYLRQLSPQLYQQEADHVAARFEQAVELAEQAFTDELAKLVSHLTERLSGSDDGRPKVFRDSAVENLTEFFDRFRHLNIRSSAELDDLVARTQQLVSGVEPQALRDNSGLRQQVSTQLAGIQSVLDGLLVDRPRRNILRRPQ